MVQTSREFLLVAQTQTLRLRLSIELQPASTKFEVAKAYMHVIILYTSSLYHGYGQIIAHATTTGIHTSYIRATNRQKRASVYKLVNK